MHWILLPLQSAVVVAILMICEVGVSITIYANQSDSQTENDLTSGWDRAAAPTTLLALQNALQCCGLKVRVESAPCWCALFSRPLLMGPLCCVTQYFLSVCRHF